MNELNATMVLTKKSPNPNVGEMCLDIEKGIVEIYDGDDWKIVQTSGEWKPSLLDSVVKLIEEADADELRTLLQNYDKIKITLEKEFLSKC